MTIRNESMDRRLINLRVFVTNARDIADVRTVVEQHGYNDAEFEAGLALCDTAEKEINSRQDEFGTQLASTRVLSDMLADAKKDYMKCLKFARIAFETNVDVQHALDLMGDRRDTFTGFITQARQFYQNALLDDAVVQEMAGIGIPREFIEAGLQKVNDLEQANMDQEKKKGKAILSTKTRDEAFDRFAKWTSRLVKVTRLAFEERPETLEMLGIKDIA